MSKYTTLVFKTETDEELEAVRELAVNDQCRAWMLDHALLKLDLIEKAVEERNWKKIEEYFGAVDSTIYQPDLEASNQPNTAAILSA